MTATRTTCPYCGVGCGLLATPESVRPDPDHPANFGRSCSKGAALEETLGLEHRLLHPRIGGRRASWAEALALVARRISGTVAEHGPDSVGFYVSGQLLTEDYYVANKLMKGFIGSANIDTNSRLCMASAVAGHLRAFGADIVPGCYEDLDHADLVVLVGSNAAWCHPVLFQRLMAAREARGTRLVVIDPRRTATAEAADLHLALRSGSDVALFNGLLADLAARGALDRDWMARHTSGFDTALAATDAAGTAALTGLDAGDVARFYDWFATTERTVTGFGQGVNQSSSGTDKTNAIINCHLATARIGRAGMGPFSLTGQPNAMGGREVGGLATQLASHMAFSEPHSIDRVRRFWGAPNIATTPGLKAVDLFDAVHDGRIKLVWVLGTNPAASMPRAEHVRAALAACPLTIVSDVSELSDTAAIADILLPAQGWGEKDGSVTNSERRISRQRAFLAAPGEARPDWWMMAEVGKRLGWEEAFRYDGAAAIFREHAALSAFENDGSRAFDIGAYAELGDAAYETLAPFQWPARRDSARQGGRFFAEGGFFTPDRRARFVATAYRAPAEAIDAAFPFRLNTGRLRDQWHSMTRTGPLPRLMRHEPEPFLAIHPGDAASLGLVTGSLLRAESRHGAAVLRARLSDAQRPGEVFAPMHWTRHFCSAGPIDALVGSANDPISGQPELKASVLRITALPTAWRGLLLRRGGSDLAGDFYWARIPQESGEAFELAGWEELPEGAALESMVETLLGSGGDRIDYSDAGRGLRRSARIAGDRLISCLFLARDESGLPAYEPLLALLQTPVTGRARVSLLSGRAASALPASGPVVCSCFAVGLQTLRGAIAEQGLTTTAEIGRSLRAGSNCGSCLPELRALLAECSASVAAAE